MAGAEVDAPRHEVIVVDVPDMPALLVSRGIEVRSMGRGPDDDPLFYASAGAAGILAGTSPAPAAGARPVGHE